MSMSGELIGHTAHTRTGGHTHRDPNGVEVVLGTRTDLSTPEKLMATETGEVVTPTSINAPQHKCLLIVPATTSFLHFSFSEFV